MQHKLYERDDDDLSHCKVCGGAEASLPTHCPGARMTEEQEAAVQAGTQDFVHDNWVVREPGDPRGSLRLELIASTGYTAESNYPNVTVAQWVEVTHILEGVPEKWDEAAERALFEAAAYAHYLKVRSKRVVFMDSTGAPMPPAEVFAREPSGDYVGMAYQMAWSGWKLAKGQVL